MRVFEMKLIGLLFCSFSFFSSAQDVMGSIDYLKSLGKIDPLTFSGGINFNTTFYDAQGIENRRDPFFWSLNANLNLTLLGKISCPLTFTLTQQDKKFTNGLDKFSQPFNQFGISPTYKWIIVHAGYRTMNFSEYSLNGALFLGGGVEIKPEKGLVSGSVCYGRFMKAIPIGGVEGISVGLPAYERWGGAAKLKIGNETNYGELIYFNAEDDPYSIAFDTVNNLAPKSNQIFGITTKQKVLEKLEIQGDFHYSMYNPNIYLPIQKLERFTYINKVFEPRSNSKFNTAINFQMTYELFKYKIGAKYKRIAPDYSSLGSVFVANDVQEISLTLNKQFMNNKINLNGSLGLTENNLDKNQIATQRRIAASINASLNVVKNLNLNLGYNSFSSNVIAVQDVFYDSIRLTQVNQTATVNVNYSFGKNVKQTTNGSLSYQEMGGNKTPLNSVLLFNPSYGLTFSKTQTAITAALTFAQNSTLGIVTRNIGPTLGIQQGFLKQKVKSGANFSLQDSRKNQQLTNYNIGANAFLNYSFLKGQSLKISYSFIYRKAESVGAQNFKENRMMVNYSYSFSSGVKKIKEKIEKKNAEI